jgi:hypothetical protein
MTRKMTLRLAPFALASAVILAWPSSATAQQPDPATCPMHAEHMAAKAHGHAADVDARGDEVMGFSHTATTHHFRILADGGAIEITANDPQDTASLAAIRSHLTTVAAAFAKGDFAMPLAIHGETPAGAPTLAGHAADIDYRYEETPQGARVHLLAKTPETLAAIHEFLRYQITEHRTGDPLEPAS